MSLRSFARRFFRVRVVAFVLIAAAFSPMTTGATGDEDWSELFFHGFELDNTVYAMTMYEGHLIVAGHFQSAGNRVLNGVARWDGTGWRPLGAGIPAGGTPYGMVMSLAVYQGDLYAEGWRWDGENWTDALEVDDRVNSLVVHDGLLVAGGHFTTARGVPVRNLLAWDGETAADLGGGCNNTIQTLASDGDRLYAGGWFTQAGDTPVQHVACWDGVSWSDLDGGITGIQQTNADDYGDPYIYRPVVYSLAVAADGLYVGGVFALAGGDSINALARWDGVGWQEIPELSLGPITDAYSMDSWQDFPPYVLALAADAAGEPVVAGRFSLPGQPDTYSVTRRGPTGWSTPGSGLNYDYTTDFYKPYAFALLSMADELFVGGEFSQAGGIEAVRAAHWDGSAWSSLVDEHGLGTDGYVFTNLNYRGELIFAGGFDDAGGVSAGCIASFHGDHWEPVGEHGITGVFPRIRDMVEFEDDLVVAGCFTAADGIPAVNVARWDGVAWQAMGAGLPCTEAAALCVHQGQLYAAGGDMLYPYPPFDRRTDRWSEGFVYHWNGADWDQIIVTDEWTTDAVRALASYDGDLIVAGSFTVANGQPMRGILAWDGSTCREFGGGLKYWTRCLLTIGDDLYAGGGISEAGGQPAHYLVRWDGAAWHDVGGGLSGGSSRYGLYDLIEMGGRLCVGGRFTAANGVPATNVAILDHGTWSALGSGAGPTVTTLAWRHGDLYVGGAIDLAGSQVVGGIARWEGLAVPVAVSEFRGRRDGLAVELEWTASPGLSGGSFRVWRDVTAGVLQLLDVGPVAEGTAYLCRDDTAPAGATLYRLQWQRDDGATEWLAEANVGAAEMPRAARFAGVHPNPFNPRITAAFVVGAPQRVRIAVADARGREVAVLADRQCEAGRHEVVWVGRDDDGRALPAGVYFLSLRGDDGRDTVKVVLVQ